MRAAGVAGRARDGRGAELHPARGQAARPRRGAGATRRGRRRRPRRYAGRVRLRSARAARSWRDQREADRRSSSATRPRRSPTSGRRGPGRARADAQLAAPAERGARRADARRAPRLRPADRRRAGDREHRDPVRRRRGHRLPDEADRARRARAGARRAARAARASAAQRETQFGDRRRAARARRPRRAGPEHWAVTPITQRAADKARGAARHERLRQPLRRVRRARRSTEPDLGLDAGRVPRAAVALAARRGPGAQVADHYSQARARACTRSCRRSSRTSPGSTSTTSRARSTGPR